MRSIPNEILGMDSTDGNNMNISSDFSHINKMQNSSYACNNSSYYWEG